MTYDEGCIFCRIAYHKAPASVLYEDDDVLAFLDIRPLTMGHALVIPRGHYVDIFDIPEKSLASVHLAVKRISAAIKEATAADGISIFQQNGKAAGQDIFHLHVHVVPRFEGQRLPSFGDLKVVERGMLEETAKRIRQRL